jgi:hypothetical protein
LDFREIVIFWENKLLIVELQLFTFIWFPDQQQLNNTISEMTHFHPLVPCYTGSNKPAALKIPCSHNKNTTGQIKFEPQNIRGICPLPTVYHFALFHFAHSRQFPTLRPHILVF